MVVGKVPKVRSRANEKGGASLNRKQLFVQKGDRLWPRGPYSGSLLAGGEGPCWRRWGNTYYGRLRFDGKALL